MMLRSWHNYLQMEKHDQAWHEQDIQREFDEYKQATGLIHRWSELSDVVYTYTRARDYSKVAVHCPISAWQFFIGLFYMYPKHSLRWWYFRRVGHCFGKEIHCVRNPKKVHKLARIAQEYDIEESAFIAKAQELQRYRLFLP